VPVLLALHLSNLFRFAISINIFQVLPHISEDDLRSGGRYRIANPLLDLLSTKDKLIRKALRCCTLA
jgi:hypothetical protein